MASERKRLMQALYDYLSNLGIKVSQEKEPGFSFFGVSVFEPVLQLKEQSIDRIRLLSTDSGGCGIPGDILRFQYEINLNKKLSAESIININASTEPIKEGKVISIFGGKVVGIKWVGQKLAEILNQDQLITDNMMKCIKSWKHLEFNIEGIPSGDVFINGAEFTNPGMIAELYNSKANEEIPCCVFGYTTVEKIGKHIKTNTF